MQLYTFETNIPYSDIDSILASIKLRIRNLRKEDARIRVCQLVDIGIRNQSNGVNIILYFAKKPSTKEYQFSLGSS